VSHAYGPLMDKYSKSFSRYTSKTIVLAFKLWPWYGQFAPIVYPQYKDNVITLQPVSLRVPIIFLRKIPKSMAIMDIYAKWMAEKAFKELNKLDLKPDLIHAQFIYPGGLIGVHLKKIYNVPLVVTGHGGDVYTYPFINTDFKKMFLTVVENSDYTITVSKSNYKVFKQLNLDDKVTVIPNPYNDELFKPIEKSKARETLSLLQDKKIILAVGNVMPIKGHEYLIKAIDKIVKRNKNIICIIIGEGESRLKLQKLINNLNLNDYVKLIGAKPHDEIPLWMNACELFVLPSLRESFGTVQIEAMACGKPVVATKNGGSEDIIVNENLGYLVEPKNPNELADKILCALNKEWDKEYILNYVKKFSSDEIARETFKIYEKVMK